MARFLFSNPASGKKEGVTPTVGKTIRPQSARRMEIPKDDEGTFYWQCLHAVPGLVMRDRVASQALRNLL